MDQRPGIPLGRVLGVPVWLSPSWLVLAVVVVVVFQPSVSRATDLVGPATYLVAAAYALLLLVSVLVHEVAHAAVARSLGMQVTHIVADLWGGHTQFADDAPSPGRSALVAFVGPAANGLLAGVGLLALLGLTGDVERLLALALAITNGFVAVFNLAPGLPLDGGRVVESAVWAVTGRRSSGTLVAGWCGRVVAVAVVAYFVGKPLLAGNAPSLLTMVWTLMIAGLLWQGATAAIGVARVRGSAERLDLARFTEPAIASPASADTWLWRPDGDRVHLVAVDAAGRPVGLLSPEGRARLRATTPGPPSGTPLTAVMTVLDPVAVLRRDASGSDVLSALTTAPAHTYVVVDAGGTVVGVAQGQRLADAVTQRQ